MAPKEKGTLSNEELLLFSEFTERAGSLATTGNEEDRGATAAFRHFVDAATPLVLDSVREWWADLHPLLSEILPWHTSHDLFHETGCRHDENLYTELLRWSLAESTDPASALQRQRGWLSDLGIPQAGAVLAASEPQTQLRTSDGVPDLVLDYPSLTVIVEAKTNTEEHEAPRSRLPQTIAYVEATRRALGAPKSKAVAVVFLTLDGHQAANPEAFCTTYGATALSLTKALRDTPLEPDVAYAFKTVITHFVASALPGEQDVRHLIQSARAAKVVNEAVLMRLRDDIRRLHDSLTKGSIR